MEQPSHERPPRAGIRTRAVHGVGSTTGPESTPIVHSATFGFPSLEAMNAEQDKGPAGAFYQRTGHPTLRGVEERLAACVNVVPGVRSVYRWHGAIETADEALLVIKTTAAAFDALAARVRALHPYSLPEVVAPPLAAALAAYLAWVEEGVKP